MPNRKKVIDAFTGLFESLVDGRVYRKVIPQDSMFPAVRYEIVGQIPHNTFSGPSELDFLTIDVHTYASDLSQAEDIADQIRFIVESETFRPDSIMSVRFKESGDDYATALSKFEIQQEYRVSFRRTFDKNDAFPYTLPFTLAGQKNNSFPYTLPFQL